MSELLPLSHPKIAALLRAAGRSPRTARADASIGVDDGTGNRIRLKARKIANEWRTTEADVREFLEVTAAARKLPRTAQ